jgi:hypothetical protein
MAEEEEFDSKGALARQATRDLAMEVFSHAPELGYPRLIAILSGILGGMLVRVEDQDKRKLYWEASRKMLDVMVASGKVE